MMENEKFARQINRLFEQVENYKNGSSSLHKLINNLEAIFHDIQEYVSDDTLIRFENAWFDLEQIYAYNLSVGVRQLSTDQYEVVEKKLDEIISIIREISELSNKSN